MPGAVGDEHHDDDFEDDPEGFTAPPHPLDRIWRHPSELPASIGPARRGEPRARARSTAWVALASAGVGAVATVALLAAFGVLDGRVKEVPRLERVQVEDAAVAKLAADVAPSIVAVSAGAADGTRRGSGVCVRHGGDILTSAHLVRGATTVTVTTSDGVQHPARLRGLDGDTDLALLHIDTGLQAAKVSTSTVQAGDSVLLVGTVGTGNTSPWIGNGIIASVDAPVAQLGGPSMDGMIATNASPGRDGVGGALLDRKGSVAGIVVAPISGDTTTYAVPIKLAAEVADELSERGVAVHGWLGIHGTDTGDGPMAVTMTPMGPAAKAGMQPGDVIVAIDETHVDTVGEVAAAIRWYDPGAKVTVKVRRNNQLFNLQVQLGSTTPKSPTPGV